MQVDQTLDNSFGKLMADRMKTDNSSCIDFNHTAAQTPINISIMKKTKDKRSRSRSNPIKTPNFSLGHSKIEQSSLMSLRPSQVYTTQAKARQPTNRMSSKSADRNRMNCGNLSRSIQDLKPKCYEKTTVSFVSK